MLSRRGALHALGGALLAGGLPVRLARAVTPGDARFVFVLLRGGLDGLDVAAPVHDGAYRRMRPTLLMAPPGEEDGGLPLDGTFALHSEVPALHRRYQAGELALVHAVGNVGLTRSHFDGQDMLQSGIALPGEQASGWLNRCLGLVDEAAPQPAVALAREMPLMLRGAHPASTWAPTTMPATDAEDLFDRLSALYAEDGLLGPVFDSGRAMLDLAEGAMDGTPRRKRKVRFEVLARAAGHFLAADDGPRVAALQMSGWDTHSGQKRHIKRKLRDLEDGLEALAEGLGDAWTRTVVVAASEFGRTAHENGNRGTDHGTAGLVMVLGGAVAGGQVLADWPGLADAQLYEGRDLKPTIDVRAVLKGVLQAHLGMPTEALDTQVFPESRAVAPLGGLLRRA